MTAYPGLGITGNGVGVTTPTAHKLAQSGLIAKTGAGTNTVRPGLFYDGVSNIVTGTANMSYNVAAFTAALTRGGSSGTVLLANDGTVNVATTAAPGSNSRIDTVYVWQREFTIDGTDSNPVIGVAQGTAAASPVAPSLAAFPGAIALANITVPAGVTATNTGTTITQTAPFTALDGTTLIRRTTAERDAITTPLVGTKVRVLADGFTYRYDGTTWRGDEVRIHGRVNRSATATTFPASYTNVGGNTFWTASSAEGITAYNGGWTVPITGVYEISYEMRADAAFLAGLTINSTSPTPTLVLAHTSQPVQSVAAITVSGKLALTAGDVVRPYLLAQTGTPAWVAGTGFFDIQWATAV